MRTLTLVRPLVAVDLETTGLDVNADRIVEISCIKINPDGSREVRTRRLNPGIPISESATAVHGIRNEDVANEPMFAQVAQGLSDFLFGCDLTGFNLENFDLPLLKKEFSRVNLAFPAADTLIIDSCRIFQAREPRDLSAALRFYCNKQLTRAHSAQADAEAAADVLLGQIARYEDLPCSIPELYQHCKQGQPNWLDPDGRLVWLGKEAALGFGKHRNRTLREMCERDPEYLRWMLGANFSSAVVDIIRAALAGNFPERASPTA